MKHGFGTYTWDQNGSKMTKRGIWIEDQFTGYGEQKDDEGNEITGEFANGKIDGKAI